jgi:hypothetical protein
VRTLVLLSLRKGRALDKPSLKRRVDRMWTGQARVEVPDLDRALGEMASEGLLTVLEDGKVQLTQRGYTLSKEWRSLLLKREPILEIVAGLTDGSITALMVILSSILAGLKFNATAFASFLTLASVSITGFSSFVLGGITEDLADILSLQKLINYSLSDIPDRMERDKSLTLATELFTVLRGEITRTNVRAALLCSTSTFLVGGIPILVYLLMPKPLNEIISLGVVAVCGVVLVRYRSMRTRSHWKIMLIQTLVIIIIAVVASLLLGGRLG